AAAHDKRRLPLPDDRSARAADLVGEASHAEIEPSIGPEAWPVEIIRDTGQGEACQQFFARVGQPIAVRVLEPPKARWRRRIDGPIMPQDPLGIRHPIGEYRAPVKAAVSIGILEPADDVGRSAQTLITSGVLA